MVPSELKAERPSPPQWMGRYDKCVDTCVGSRSLIIVGVGHRAHGVPCSFERGTFFIWGLGRYPWMSIQL